MGTSSVLAAMASLDGFLGHFDMLFDDDRNRVTRLHRSLEAPENLSNGRPG